MSEPDDLIERLAREAGAWTDEIAPRPGRAVRFAALRRFAALVANECSTIVMSHQLPRGTEWCDVREEFAAAIRAKFKEPT